MTWTILLYVITFLMKELMLVTGVVFFLLSSRAVDGLFNRGEGFTPEGINSIQQAAPAANPEDRSFLERR